MEKGESFSHIYMPEKGQELSGPVDWDWLYTGVKALTGQNQLNEGFPKGDR